LLHPLVIMGQDIRAVAVSNAKAQKGKKWVILTAVTVYLAYP